MSYSIFTEEFKEEFYLISKLKKDYSKNSLNSSIKILNKLFRFRVITHFITSSYPFVLTRWSMVQNNISIQLLMSQLIIRFWIVCDPVLRVILSLGSLSRYVLSWTIYRFYYNAIDLFPSFDYYNFLRP